MKPHSHAYSWKQQRNLKQFMQETRACIHREFDCQVVRHKVLPALHLKMVRDNKEYKVRHRIKVCNSRDSITGEKIYIHTVEAVWIDNTKSLLRSTLIHLLMRRSLMFLKVMEFNGSFRHSVMRSFCSPGKQSGRQ